LSSKPESTLSAIMSALASCGHNASWFIADPTHAVQQMTCAIGRLLDHLVGAAEERKWDGEAERSRGLQVDKKLDLLRLLNRQV